MARFQQKILDPLVKDATSKVEQALGVDDITARTDSLIAARDESDAKFAGARRREIFKVAGATIGSGISMAASYLGVSTATSLMAVLAGTTGFAWPLAAIGLAAVFACATFAAVSGSNIGKLDAAQKSVSNQIDVSVASLMKAHPAETAKSSKLTAYLKRVFNRSSADTEPAPAAAPVPAMKAHESPSLH